MKKNILFAAFIIIAIVSAHAQVTKFKHPEGKFIKVNGANLWVEAAGKGDPLFLISGGPGGSHVGLHSMDSLSTTSTLVYIDNYGRGKSDLAKDPSEYTINRDVEDMEGIRKAMGYEKINVLGHSYGGMVVQAYAIKYPQHVKHLIIANSFFSGEMWQANDDNCNHEIKTNYPEVWEQVMAVRAKGAHSSDPEHVKVYGEVPYGFLYAYNPDKFLHGMDPSYPNSFNLQVYYQMVGDDGDFIIGGDVAKADYRKQLKELNMPVLILAGRYDRVSVPSFAVQYKTYCPQAQFVMFEKSGHNPQVEEPEKEFKLIREFLAN